MSYSVQEWEKKRKTLEHEAKYPINEENWECLRNLFGEHSSIRYKYEDKYFGTIEKMNASNCDLVEMLVTSLYFSLGDWPYKIAEMLFIQEGKTLNSPFDKTKETIILFKKRAVDTKWSIYLYQP